MKKLLLVLLLSICYQLAIGQVVYIPPIAAGHTIAPHMVFFNADCSRAMTVSKAEIITWDMAAKKTIHRAVLAASMKGYNPYNEKVKIKATPSPDLTQVIIELSAGEQKQAFIFDMKTAKLAIGDAGLNPWIASFTESGDYVTMRDLRVEGKNPNQVLQTFLKPDGGMNVVVNEVKKFAFTGFSLNGALYWGKNTDNNRFILYNPATGKVTETKLKYSDKIKHFFYYYDGMYTDKWLTRAPTGKDWKLSNYEVSSGKTIDYIDKDGIDGPWVFSDDGKLGVYYNNKTLEYLLREPFSQTTVHAFKAPAGVSQAAYVRIPTNNRIYVLGEDGTQLFTYSMDSNMPKDQFSVMGSAQVVASSKVAQEIVQKVEDVDAEALSDFNLKNFLVNFPSMQSFSFNLSTAHNLKGADITNLPFTKAHYTGSLGKEIKVLSVLGLGKIATCGSNAVVFGVVRAVVNGNEDRTLFFIETLGPTGESLAYENLGFMSKITNGGNFLANLDLSMSSGNNKTAIVIEQRFTKSPKSNYKRTYMINHLNCTITK